MPHPSPSNPRPARCAERGLTLIELLIAIIVIGIAVTGTLMLFNRSVRASADPMVRKQAVAIAESMLNEVMAQAFTYCDPQDAANTATPAPTSTASCTGGAAGSQDRGGAQLGPQPSSEGRFNATDPFDNVGDYNGYLSNGVVYGMDDGANRITALDGYSVGVSVYRVS